MLTEFEIEGNVKRFTLLCLLNSGVPYASIEVNVRIGLIGSV